MATATVRHPTQTLRQAKAAYRKSGPGHRFTETEIRQINRNAELLERAERIRKKERNKKKNKRSKEQKLEKERESRRQAGRPDIREANIIPGQPTLNAFLPGGILSKREEITNDDVSGSNSRSTRNLLEAISGNYSIKSTPSDCTLPNKSLISQETEWADLFVSNTQIAQELLPAKTSPTTQQARTVFASINERSAVEIGNVPDSLNQTLKEKGRTLTKVGQGRHMKDFRIEKMLVGNDLRELDSKSEYLIPEVAKEDNSTSQEPNPPRDDALKLAIQNESCEHEDAYTDNEFEDLAQEILPAARDTANVEPVSVLSEPNSNINPAYQQELNDDNIFDEFAPSSQDLLNLEWDDEFDSSIILTQDLLNLVP